MCPAAVLDAGNKSETEKRYLLHMACSFLDGVQKLDNQ